MIEPMNSLHPHAGWTAERVEVLTRLWKDGRSCSEIARKLGGVTRNACIGKIHRLGLMGRIQAYKPGRPFAAPKAPRPPPPPKAPKEARPKAALKIAGRGAVFVEAEARLPRATVPECEEARGSETILTLRPRMCRWPIGDTRDPDFSFCGCDAPDGPYCTTSLDANGRSHRDRAYQQSTPSKRAIEPLQARAKARFA